MNKNSMAALILLVLATSGCGSSDPHASTQSPEADQFGARTRVVAVHDRCVVLYTRTAVGPNVNWVRCFDDAGQAEVYNQTRVGCGKNCTRTLTVATLAAKP